MTVAPGCQRVLKGPLSSLGGRSGSMIAWSKHQGASSASRHFPISVQGLSVAQGIADRITPFAAFAIGSVTYGGDRRMDQKSPRIPSPCAAGKGLGRGVSGSG